MVKKIKCLISDAGFYIDTIRPELIKRNNALTEISINHFLNICLSSSLSEVFCLPIVFPQVNRTSNKLNHVESYFYSRVKTLSDTLVFNNIDRKSLSMFDGFEIVCFLNGRQLFLLNHDEQRR